MELNQYYWDLAVKAAGKTGYPIQSEWIYSQWYHETNGFTSALCVEYNNLGGLTQVEPNDIPQPDGSYYYMKFNTPEDYAEYFGKYLRYYREDGLFESTNLDEYIEALKRGSYFGDTIENYKEGCHNVYDNLFGK